MDIGFWFVPCALASGSGLGTASPGLAAASLVLAAAWAGPGLGPAQGLGGMLAGQASVQAPSRRVSPCRSRVRRLIAAHRVCSQALFLAVPR